MHIPGFLLSALLAFLSASNNDAKLLNDLNQEAKITAKEYQIFQKQIAFKSGIGFNQRLDSLAGWNLDIVYTEETYFYGRDSFLIREFYFSSKKAIKYAGKDQFYYPDRYYENGVLQKHHFIEDEQGREHLRSIQSYMNTRKTIDKIQPLARIEVEHAGCGMTWKYMAYERKAAEKKYRKARTPNYYLTETLLEPGQRKVSFQRPVKAKFKVIVEGHSW